MIKRHLRLSLTSALLAVATIGCGGAPSEEPSEPTPSAQEGAQAEPEVEIFEEDFEQGQVEAATESEDPKQEAVDGAEEPEQ